MSLQKYWSISYYDTGSSAWIKDTNIPRAGLDPFSRSKNSTIDFIELADATLAKISSENRSNWQRVTLTFPRQSINETVKDQILGYIDNEKGVKIVVPIKTGASLYTEKIIEGYMISYEEDWELTGDSQQKFVIKVTMQEFDVDGS